MYAKSKEYRLIWAKHLLPNLKNQGPGMIFFSDEKNFEQTETLNDGITDGYVNTLMTFCHVHKPPATMMVLLIVHRTSFLWASG